MAVQITNIVYPPRKSWLSYDPINASDLGEVVELAQSEYARIGGSSTFHDQAFATTAETFTTSTSGSEDLQEFPAMLTGQRALAAEQHCQVVFWGVEIEMLCRVYRLNSDGSSALVETNSETVPNTNFGVGVIELDILQGDARDFGNVNNDPVPLEFRLEHRWTPIRAGIGRHAYPKVTAGYTSGSRLP